MAVADAPGLMDIASTLIQDEIPFKLRCAICNKLAVNAFRLPCCDQSICETCQASLSDTCPVCTHTPVSPDLCKPNKALRTTLKAFLRTEEKKREKDRQSAAPPTPSTTTPAETKIPVQDAAPDQNGTEITSAAGMEAPLPTEPTAPKSEGSELATLAPDTVKHIVPVLDAPVSTDQPAQNEAAANQLNGTDAALEPVTEDIAVKDSAVIEESAPSAQEAVEEPDHNSAAPSMAGNTPAMGWNGNGMNPFMTGMFNFPNTMGMPMGMGPMANQGMYGGYGMNMTGMGMNTGMNYNGGMYGSLGWDASQQSNNMWQGGQNKFNPNAFANGTGPHGGAFGGSNMSAYPSHSEYQSGYYGGYGRGGFRGRGRGQFHGSGRGGFGTMQGHYRQGANSGYTNQNPSAVADGSNATMMDAQGNVQTIETVPESSETGPNVSGDPDDIQTGSSDQLQGIPTIESLDNSVSAVPTYGHMNNAYGQHRYGRYGQERGPGVEGAPAAPRAMREGLPNTSVLRQRGFQIQGRASISLEPTEENRARATSHALSQRAQSRSQSPPKVPAPQVRPPSVHGTEDDRDSRRGTEVRRMDRVDELQSKARYSRSPSRTSSRRSSRRRHHDSDRERDRRTGHRSQRSRRHRSRSCSSTRTGDVRPSGRPERDATKNGSGRTRVSSEAPESRDLASRVSSSYRSTKDRPSRREDGKSREEDRDIRRRDRDSDRDRDRHGRERDSDRERRRDSERDKHRASDRDRDRPRERERDRDRKRSRRDRSPSANGTDHPQARRVKHDEDRSRDANGTSTKTNEPEKDPYTLEREARNKERLEREKQHRDKAKSGRRRDSRQDRVVAGRRINYKYEDEL